MNQRRRPAQAAALLILSLGLLALVLPSRFAGLVAAMQVPPLLYLAALIRFLVGVTLLRAASISRARLALFFLGVVMVLGGIATPIFGQGMARPILDAWQQGGDMIVRGWGLAAAALGGFLLWAMTPRSKAGP
jgi:hypothetical protein